MNEGYCKNITCYNSAEYGDYCEKHSPTENERKTFSAQMSEAYKTMEERMVTLEEDVKRLKRELGLK